jgi:hypothetical protein
MGSTPKPLPAAKASPDNLRTTLLYMPLAVSHVG